MCFFRGMGGAGIGLSSREREFLFIMTTTFFYETIGMPVSGERIKDENDNGTGYPTGYGEKLLLNSSI